MNSSQPSLTRPAATQASVSTSQYLKISYSSKRYYLLMALAQELGCSWQSIALAAIDELLDREAPLKNRP